MKGQELIEKAKAAKKESKYVDFKEQFDIGSSRDWCEIIKDVVAMANSGGGLIVLGVRNDGTPSGFDVTSIVSIDPAKITDKIAKYTGEHFCDFEITELEKKRRKVAIIQISGVSIPMIFIQPGTYNIGDGKQHNAFGRGTIYFRHGAKSEPGNSDDLRKVIERELESVRKAWLGKVRRVIQAPAAYRVKMFPPEVVETAIPGAVPIRIVDDPNAPAYRKLSPDFTHPHRQKEVVQLVNRRLEGKKTINTFDEWCVRRTHKVENNFLYCHKPKFSTFQYSGTYVDWMVDEYSKDALFFDRAREKCKQKLK